MLNGSLELFKTNNDRGRGDDWKLLHAPASIKLTLKELFFTQTLDTVMQRIWPSSLQCL